MIRFPWLRPSLTVVATVLLLGSLGSCSGAFDVRPTGRLGQDITFSFYQMDAAKPSNFRITSLVVQEQTAAGWKLIWVLNGDQSLPAIIYGAKYRRLKEERAVRPLVREGTYRVVASASGLSGAAEFSFDRNGNLVPH